MCHWPRVIKIGASHGSFSASIATLYYHRRPQWRRKATFAREFLTKEAGVIHFVNPDLIASGLSPLRPELAALAAGRLFLQEIDRLARSKEDFAFESTLSGLTYVTRLQRWKAGGGVPIYPR